MFSKWSSNTVNNDENHKGMDLEEADGDDDLDSEITEGQRRPFQIWDHLLKIHILIL